MVAMRVYEGPRSKRLRRAHNLGSGGGLKGAEKTGLGEHVPLPAAASVGPIVAEQPHCQEEGVPSSSTPDVLARALSNATPDPKEKAPRDDTPPATVPAPRRLRKVDTDELVRERFDLYRKRPLSKSAFSEVLAVVERNSGQKRALKKVDKAAVKHYLSRCRSHLSAESEVELQRRLHHPGIVRLYESFETESSICMVMDLLEGGDLLRYIMQRDSPLEEGLARKWFGNICQTVKHLHSQDIIHRDLKPENILLTSDAVSAEVKLADFGISRQLPSAEECNTFCGTLDYIAPEVLAMRMRQESKEFEEIRDVVGYGKAADMWSLGVVLYIMLSKVPPFDCSIRAELPAQVLSAAWGFDVDAWKCVSAEAKHLVSGLLKRQPEDRLTISQALEHPWLTSVGEEATAFPRSPA